MLCKKPYWKGNQAYGCGQCLFCRINKRRLWTHRILLESLMHTDNAFITLTYSPENLPENGTLVPKHLTDYIKRLRKNYGQAIRYYAVGEYGDKSCRPHYHIAAFGIHFQNSAIGKSWKYGHIHSGTITKDSAQYIASYTVKKLTSKDDARLCGRYPEFARMSRKPGIGAGAVAKIARDLETKEGSELIAKMLDVPSTITHDGKQWPIGRYLKQRLRDEIGYENLGNDTPETQARAAEMQVLLDSKNYFDRPLKSFEKTSILNAHNAQKQLNSERRFKIFNQSKKI